VTPTLFIALRFLAHRKRSFLLSLCGVVFGVAFFVCIQAQTQGFADHFIESTIGSSGAVVVSSRIQPRANDLLVGPSGSFSSTNYSERRSLEGIANSPQIMRVARQFSNVVAGSPVLRGRLSARAGFESATVELFGVEPQLHLQTTDLARQLIGGSMENFRNNPSAVIIGSRLADSLELQVGSVIQLLAPGGEYRRVPVAAIARSGVGAVDAVRIYSHTRVAQTLLNKPYGASMIMFKLRDPTRAPELAQRFATLFEHDAQSWQDREQGNLQLFVTLRMSAAITVSLVILLAGFGIFNVLTMSVLAKVKEIAILRSMGYRRGDISAIFLWQGVLMAAAGSILGCALGALLTWGVSRLPIHVRGLLYADHFLVAWDWHHYLWGTLLALIAVFVASYVPARRAGKLSPVVTLRGASA
jgi:lipoprotein-releasing system permease protein